MLTASLVCRQCSPIFMVAHKRVLESFALFHGLGDRGSSNNQSLFLDTGKRFESFKLRQEFLPRVVSNIWLEFEKDCTWLESQLYRDGIAYQCERSSFLNYFIFT